MNVAERFENLDKALEIKSQAKGLLTKRKEVSDNIAKLQTQLDEIDSNLETYNRKLDSLFGVKKGRGRKPKGNSKPKEQLSDEEYFKKYGRKKPGRKAKA